MPTVACAKECAGCQAELNEKDDGAEGGGQGRQYSFGWEGVES